MKTTICQHDKYTCEACQTEAHQTIFSWQKRYLQATEEIRKLKAQLDEQPKERRIYVMPKKVVNTAF